MVHRRKFSLVLGAMLLTGVMLQTAAADTVPAAVGRPLQQAEVLLQKRDFQGALRKVQQASAVRGLTPYESLMIAQVHGAAAAGAGDYTQAALDYQAVLASGLEPAAAQIQLIQAIAGFYDQARDYPHVIIWIDRYIASHGSDFATRALLAQAYYETGDYTDAEHAAWREVNAAQAAGRTPPEAELQLLASSSEKSGDSQGYWNSLQLLLDSYESREYWAMAIDTLVATPEFPDRLTLDVYRLRFATGTLTAPGDYEDYAERALLANKPVEAKTVIDHGFASGILTPQTDAGHAQRLRILAAKEAATAPPVAAGDVQQVDDHAASPEVLLDQGFSDFQAGDMPHAVETFKSVPGYAYHANHDPAVLLARLWAIRADEPR